MSIQGGKIMAQLETSPLTGIIEEDKVFLDFGEHEGKSILEVQDTLPAYYEFLCEQKKEGKSTIRRSKDKCFRMHVAQTVF